MVATIQDIKLFVAAYEEPTFAAAAARAGATQPGVSYHIRQLENMLDTKLFIREKQSNLPTPAADKYYRHCLEVLRAYDAARAAMRPFKGTSGSRLTIGVIPSLTRRALSPALKAFMEQNPNSSVHIVEANGQFLASMVLSGELDFALSAAIGDIAGVRTRHLFTSDIYLVSRRIDDGPTASVVQMSSLDPIKLIWWGRRNTFRQLLQRYCRDNDVQIEATIELDSITGSFDLVRQSDWSMLLPVTMMTDIDLNEFSIRKIVNPNLSLSFYLVTQTAQVLDEEMESFVTGLTQEAKLICDGWDEVLKKR